MTEEQQQQHQHQHYKEKLLSSFEYVVISIREERKKSFLKQYKDLNLKAPFSFLENPATCENSKNFVQHQKDHHSKSILCCLLSHLRAIKQAITNAKHEFAVILEDDVALHKTQFENGICEIIQRWGELVAPTNIMASIGWVPCKNYETYLTEISPHPNPPKTLKCILGSKVLVDRYVPGAQGYIVRIKDISPIIETFFEYLNDDFLSDESHSYRDFKRFLDNSPRFNWHSQIGKGEDDALVADRFLNYLFGQSIIFPPLAAEQNFTSSLSRGKTDSNHERYWNPFFKNYESIRDNYYFLDEKDL